MDIDDTEVETAFFESRADHEGEGDLNDNLSNLGGTPETNADDSHDVRSGSVRFVHPLSFSISLFYRTAIGSWTWIV